MNKFYHFLQNNSGGSFDITEDLDVHVIIEASSAPEANDIALRKGIYFNGVDDGLDCECCGDRWYPVIESDGKEFPHMYGRKLEEDDTNVRIHNL